MNHAQRPIRVPALVILLAVAWAVVGVLRPALAQPTDATVTIGLDSFGLGGWWRPGALTPVRLTINYAGAKPLQPAMVVWEQQDGDGDIQELSQIVALNPGNNAVWLYVPLRYPANASTIWDVIVYEYENDLRGIQLAAKRLTANSPPRSEEHSIIGIVGMRPANVSDYIVAGQFRDTPPTAHEVTDVLSNLTVEQLPDRWMGLDMLEALIWTQGEPSQLSIDQADAIEQWIKRGGHLVIVLPQVGEAWKSSRLDPILPDVQVQRFEGIELRDNISSGGLLRQLGRMDRVAPDTREPRFPIINVHAFTPVGPSWSQGATIPLMEIDLPDGEGGGMVRRAVVVQRPLGYGRVTLVGIPVADAALNRPGLDLPQAEVFWNPILGRRQDTPRASELNSVLTNSQSTAGRTRNPARLSQVIPQQTHLSAAAGKGLLLALVLFIVYWGVSGPLAFTLLKYRKWSRFNWPAFVGITAVFTAMSWMGAMALRSNEILPVHLTFLDHIADSEFERSTSFITVALTGYGDRLIDVRASVEEHPGDSMHNVVTSMSVPLETIRSFPDVRRYFTDSSDQSRFRAPARCTSKSLYVSSAHPPSDGWRMPNFTLDAERPRISADGALQGVVTHQLPGTLRDVTVYFASNTIANFNPRADGRQQGSARLRIYAWKPAQGTWAPNVPLDFGALAEGRMQMRDLVTHPIDGYFKTVGDNAVRPHIDYRTFFNPKEVTQSLEALTFFNALNPPEWAQPPQTAQPQFLRTLGRENDLSAWFARPCVIITGFLDSSPIPYPLRIEGILQMNADARSVTMVRWIYPLPVDSQPLPSGQNGAADEP